MSNFILLRKFPLVTLFDGLSPQHKRHYKPIISAQLSGTPQNIQKKYTLSFTKQRGQERKKWHRTQNPSLIYPFRPETRNFIVSPPMSSSSSLASFNSHKTCAHIHIITLIYFLNFLFETKQAKSVATLTPTRTTISFFFLFVCETRVNSKQQVIRSCMCGECGWV